MWRLTQHDRDDRGVVTLFVIGIIAVLLFAAAFGIDVSRFSQENSSAQHSADATALAVATDCARSLTKVPQLPATYDVYRKIPEQVISESTPINSSSCSGDKVTITVEKDVNSGLILNRDAGRVHKTAEVTLTEQNLLSIGLTTTPLTIAGCEFDEALLAGTENIKLYFDNPSPNKGCSGLPGGFSELPLGKSGVPDNPATAIDEAYCTVKPLASGELPGDPGKDHQKYRECINPTGATAPLNLPVLIPIYESDVCTKANGCKGKGPYPLRGYAMFVIKGYDLKKANMPSGVSCADSCLYGDFIEFILPSDLPDVVTGDPDPEHFGSIEIRLSK